MIFQNCVPYCIILHYIILHYTDLYNILYTKPQHIILHYIMLHYTDLYNISYTKPQYFYPSLYLSIYNFLFFSVIILLTSYVLFFYVRQI